VSGPLREIERRRLPALAGEIAEHALAAEKAWRDALGHAIAAGEKLIEAKSLVKHGEWLPWLRENFPGGERTAQNYMKLAANAPRVADLPTVREAVALLAAPKQPHPVDVDADDEAIEREARARVVARWGEHPNVNPHIAAARQALAVVDLCGERGARAALALAGEHLADGPHELVAAAYRMAAAHLAPPWDEDTRAAFGEYALLRAGGEP
jgi:hypothetical protein